MSEKRIVVRVESFSTRCLDNKVRLVCFYPFHSCLMRIFRSNSGLLRLALNNDDFWKMYRALNLSSEVYNTHIEDETIPGGFSKKFTITLNKARYKGDRKPIFKIDNEKFSIEYVS